MNEQHLIGFKAGKKKKLCSIKKKTAIIALEICKSPVSVWDFLGCSQGPKFGPIPNGIKVPFFGILKKKSQVTIV